MKTLTTEELKIHDFVCLRIEAIVADAIDQASPSYEMAIHDAIMLSVGQADGKKALIPAVTAVSSSLGKVLSELIEIAESIENEAA